MSDVVLLVPNDWVSEKVLIAVTGLKPGTILRARKECWLVGREYVHVSPDGNPKPSS
ncbi:excisionase family protein, partial [Enterobacter hormaechei]